jgi:hypothetical protein
LRRFFIGNRAEASSWSLRLHLEQKHALSEAEWVGSIVLPSWIARLAFFSLTPAFNPVDAPHSAQLSRFSGFRMLTTQSTQHSADIGFDTKPLKRLTSISCGESPT